MADTAKTAAKPTGIALAMKFFGKRTMPDGKPQGLAAFRDEWNELGVPAQRQILAGIEDGTLTYA